MRTLIIGAGPTGLYTAIALARRGHQIEVIDRDHGPGGGQRWDRRGVMQFHHPHFFRQQVVDAVLAEMPDVWHRLLAAGAEPATVPGMPGIAAGLHCRRLTFERVLRSAAKAAPGITLRTGHADEVCCERGRVTGVLIDGHQVPADLVIDASGRAGRLTRPFRGPVEGGDCGIAYVSRQYELLPDAPAGPMRRGEALETFHRHRHILRNELGLDPHPEIQRLQQEILNSEPTSWHGADRVYPSPLIGHSAH